MRDRKLILIALALVAALVFGEAYIYTFDEKTAYSATSSIQGTDIQIELESKVPTVYDAIVLGNGSYVPVTGCYVYYDAGYAENLNEVDHATGGKTLTQEYYVSQMVLQLRNRGVESELLNASELAQKLQEDISASDCHKALIIVSGALPDTIYDGYAGSLVKNWITAGGGLYWAGGLLGSKVSSTTGLTDANCNPMVEFFGVDDCYNTSEDALKGYEEVGNGFRSTLSLMSNGISYAVDVSSMSNCLQAGYTDGTYSSITLVKCGAGMICVIAGDYSNTQRSDLVQVVASHLCFDSEIVDHSHGEVKRWHPNELTLSTNGVTGNLSVYVYFGGYYLEYARVADYSI